MNRIEEIFGVSRVLLPVVHPVGWSEAIDSVRVASDAGVKGVFLINQGMDTDDVLRLVVAVRQQFPALWVGLNLLGRSPAQALTDALDACEGRIDGIWTDNARVDEEANTQAAAHEFVEVRRQRGWTGLYFGGVAFKYQREVAAENLGKAAAIASEFVDVICTSGPGTGMAAELDKIVAIRRGVGADVAIALASGVSAANAANYLPHVNAYLVGTGIEAGFGVLDPHKVSELQQIVAQR